MKRFIALFICALVLVACCVISVSAEDTLPYEIEGVELLSTETISNNVTSIYEIVLFSILIVANIGCIIVNVTEDGWSTSDTVYTILMGIIIVLCIIGIVINAIDLATNEPTTNYKVTIADGVDYVEFTEHYKEIDCKGKIHTIIEKK